MQDTKDKIRIITENYKTVYSEDYAATVKYVKEVRKSTRNKWGELEGVKGEGFIKRKVGEFPEILYDMLQQGLTQEEWNQWTDDPQHKLNMWFFQAYPEFRITTAV